MTSMGLIPPLQEKRSEVFSLPLLEHDQPTPLSCGRSLQLFLSLWLGRLERSLPVKRFYLESLWTLVNEGGDRL